MSCMVERKRPQDPAIVRPGTRWLPRYPHINNQTALDIIAKVDLPNGTNFIVQPVEHSGHASRTRRISYKHLLARYYEAPPSSS
jgi:hypothetical protein